MKEISAWAEYCKALAPAIQSACQQTAVASGPAALLKAIAAEVSDWQFREVLCRGGWYRLGGVLRADGSKLAEDIEQWAERELDARGGDLGFLADDYEGQTLYATRQMGRTHYLVAPAGDKPADFLQLEIEELQEVRGHRLFADGVPGGIDELVDPRQDASEAVPLGLPRYRFKRLSHVGAFLQRMLTERPEPSPIHRLVEDWAASSAGATSDLCNHWVIGMREHLDRYHNPIFRAQPIATLAGELPAFEGEKADTGTALQTALQHFDRAVGYPMAWYFHMLTSKAVPHWVAQTVVEDALGGFAYLPQRDVDVVRKWLHRPYSV